MPRGRPKGKKNLKQKEHSKSPVRNDEDEDFKGPVETFSQKIEKKKFSSTLFTEKGHPLSFYVAPSESKDKLTGYIQVYNYNIRNTDKYWFTYYINQKREEEEQ